MTRGSSAPQPVAKALCRGVAEEGPISTVEAHCRLERTGAQHGGHSGAPSKVSAPSTTPTTHLVVRLVFAKEPATSTASHRSPCRPASALDWSEFWPRRAEHASRRPMTKESP